MYTVAEICALLVRFLHYAVSLDGYSYAGVAQLVERQLPKLNVASSNLVSRFAGVAQW